MEILNKGKVYNFMALRKMFLGISGVFFVASLLLLLTKGLNFGIDFAGGTIVQVQYKDTAPISKIRDIVQAIPEYKNVSVTKFGSDREIIIKLPTSTTSLANDIGDTIRKTLKSTGEFEIRRVDMVGPKVGDELKTKGIMALSLSMIVILAYVSFRFEWRFAVASIFALIHDITIVLGFISLFEVDVNLDILAALLTILGYSLNDTIIVFDRVREGIQNSKATELSKLINESVSKTLSRTTLTSLTTFFVVLTLYIYGGEIINGFSFSLLVGVVVGTYSSIFVAAVFLFLLNFSIKDFRAKEAAKEKVQKEKDRIRAMYEQGTV
jgi:preprotein translocase subunit SecF